MTKSDQTVGQRSICCKKYWRTRTLSSYCQALCHLYRHRDKFPRQQNSCLINRFYHWKRYVHAAIVPKTNSNCSYSSVTVHKNIVSQESNQKKNSFTSFRPSVSSTIYNSEIEYTGTCISPGTVYRSLFCSCVLTALEKHRANTSRLLAVVFPIYCCVKNGTKRHGHWTRQLLWIVDTRRYGRGRNGEKTSTIGASRPK